MLLDLRSNVRQMPTGEQLIELRIVMRKLLRMPTDEKFRELCVVMCKLQ
jgi:hypothetical protein